MYYSLRIISESLHSNTLEMRLKIRSALFALKSGTLASPCEFLCLAKVQVQYNTMYGILVVAVTNM